jgi:hypothetical protein
MILFFSRLEWRRLAGKKSGHPGWFDQIPSSWSSRVGILEMGILKGMVKTALL